MRKQFKILILWISDVYDLGYSKNLRWTERAVTSGIRLPELLLQG